MGLKTRAYGSISKYEGDVFMIKIEKITEDNFEILICEKLKGILDRDELLTLMRDIAYELDYEVRSRW